LFLAAFCIVSAQTNSTFAEATNSESITERIQQLSGEIGRLESRCVPTNGTSRADLEIKFGTGKAAFNGMVPPPGGIPADSPYRAYDFCTNGTLFVCYDKTWHVESARYIDPYAVNNRFSLPQPEEVRRELEPRLQQMKQIAEVYNKRFGGDSQP
jgi:hypothetical protein